MFRKENGLPYHRQPVISSYTISKQTGHNPIFLTQIASSIFSVAPVHEDT